MTPSKNALSAPWNKLQVNLPNLKVISLKQLRRLFLRYIFFKSPEQNFCGSSDFQIFTSSSLQKLYGFTWFCLGNLKYFTLIVKKGQKFVKNLNLQTKNILLEKVNSLKRQIKHFKIFSTIS